MRYVLTVLISVLAGTATAHPGHLIEVAGHDHLLGGAAIGIAILAGLWGAAKGRKPEAEVEQDDDAEGEPA